MLKQTMLLKIKPKNGEGCEVQSFRDNSYRLKRKWFHTITILDDEWTKIPERLLKKNIKDNFDNEYFIIYQ